jgi:hypothetical protein
VQAAIVRGTATARTKDPSRTDLDRVAFLISDAVPACAGENFMAGTTDIFILHVLVDHKARSALSDPRDGIGRAMPEIESRHGNMPATN